MTIFHNITIVTVLCPMKATYTHYMCCLNIQFTKAIIEIR